MQNKKQQFISMLSTLALTFVLSGGLARPETAPGNPNPAFWQPPVEEEMPETDAEVGIQPLTDIDEPVTSFPQ